MERRVSIIKKIIKQGFFGMPGPQTDPIDRTLLETALARAVSMVNNTPFLNSSNALLLSPADTVTPCGGCPSVQELPPSKLKSLEEARRIMLAKQDRMRQVKEEETRLQVSRFKAARLRLNHNKGTPSIAWHSLA